MTTMREVSKSNILKEVMRAIRSARKEILATMELAEEIKYPLPKKYFLLLGKKLDDGVAIKRLAFGAKTDFIVIRNKLAIKNRNYQMRLAKTREYKRMLLIDRKYLFFAKETRDRRRFFSTSDSAYIRRFFRYFQGNFK